ncbi:RIP metalloprotease RseP [Aureibaculum sp. A20]|uniref:Zinc metalloprotease n=1 Tax=Aureibaculum flavum TaxID=2795986 RepID=A0ABS0WSJ5_9FLAO|nr:RIP metalloprotease RseP [Aureibaculum flavum]MBJ2174957.1 RIP metalloprotease RseP [Aureibaculum flavum]
MEIFIKVSQFILSLSILIVLHELGHYIPAKIFKTRVEKFYLFFDYKFSIFKKKIGETVYGIGWIPLGGYVKISGMIDESMDTDQMKEEPKPWEFRSKPAWQRLIIMLGGVTVNFLLGIFIYILMMNIWGEQYLPNENLTDGVWVQNELGEELGLQTGDKILTIDGEKIQKFRDLFLEFINGNAYTIERNGEVIEKDIPVDFISKLVDGEKEDANFLSPRIPFFIGKVIDTLQNANSGLQPKDIVVAINKRPIKYFDEVDAEFSKHKNEKVTLTVKRDNSTEDIDVTLDNDGKIGVQLAMMPQSDMEKLGYYKFETKTYTFIEAIPAGMNKAWTTFSSYLKQLKKIFNPSTGAYKGLGGFISIGSIFPSTWDWQTFLSITAFLSIMLGVMNLLPIPALDGGHVVFTLYEMISGRKPSDKFLEYAQIAGFIFLIALLLFANGNDIYRHLFK